MSLPAASGGVLNPTANKQAADPNREAFDALAAAMRDAKRRYFHAPPLAD
jgi:hypothetical protein